jgi:hypothetical protein
MRPHVYRFTLDDLLTNAPTASCAPPPLKVLREPCTRNPAKHANLGISLPGAFEEPKAPVYIDGKLSTTLRGDTIVADFKQILDRYVESHYGPRAKSGEMVEAR